MSKSLAASLRLTSPLSGLICPIAAGRALLHGTPSLVAGPGEARESQNAHSMSCIEVGQVARAVKRMLAYVVGGIVGRHRTRDVAVGHLDKVEADHEDVLHT